MAQGSAEHVLRCATPDASAMVPFEMMDTHALCKKHNDGDDLAKGQILDSGRVLNQLSS